MGETLHAVSSRLDVCGATVLAASLAPDTRSRRCRLDRSLRSDYDVVWNGKDFHGQIGKIGDGYYLQLQRTELKPEIAPLLHAVPVYAIARVNLADDNTLEVFAIDEVRAPRILSENKL